MRAALYVRVSTDRQQQAQTIEQQVTQLRAWVATHDGWTVREEHIFRDDGHSGAKLDRPGLDALRDHAARAAFDVVLVTAPDRLARNLVHQMWCWRSSSAVACGGVLRSAAQRRPARAAGRSDPRRGRRVRAGPDRRPDAARTAGAAAQRAAAAMDAGALRVSAAS